METIRNFLDDWGRLIQFPAKRKKKIPALRCLAEKFESGRVYTEAQVNDLLEQWHTFHDPATLRRELYDSHFLDRSRDGKVYRLAEKQPTAADLGIRP